MKEKEELEYYNILFERAVSRYLDKTDFDVFEWLFDDEREEFNRIRKKYDI